MPQLRRGFITEAEWYASSYRAELDLQEHEPLCPRELAKLLGVPVLAATDVCSTAERQALLQSGDFHAVTAPLGKTAKFIVHNDTSALVRQNSDLMHELAHITLNHQFSTIIGMHGDRNFDAVLEREAEMLSGILLIPKPAAMHILTSGLATPQACNDYGVSVEMLNFRLNKSGARMHFERRRRKATVRR